MFILGLIEVSKIVCVKCSAQLCYSIFPNYYVCLSLKHSCVKNCEYIYMHFLFCNMDRLKKEREETAKRSTDSNSPVKLSTEQHDKIKNTKVTEALPGSEVKGMQVIMGSG